MTNLLSVLAIWAAAAAVLEWTQMPGRWRHALALVPSVMGLVFLVLALNSEGFRETQSTAVFLLGTPYVTSLASASASLPYYILTGLCLMLGSLGLAIGDAWAKAASQRWMAVAIATSLLVLLVRFLLEKAAAPAGWTRLFGVTWLAPVVGGFFWLRLREAGRGLGALAGSLLLYALAVRGAVAALYVAATGLRLGSHYDLSSVVAVESPWGPIYHFNPGSLSQVLSLAIAPQLVIWPLYTVLSGMLGAGLAAVVAAAGSRGR